MTEPAVSEADDNDRKRNRRTALVLASVALVFFLGVILRRWLFGE